MKINFVEAVIQGNNSASQALLDSLVDVPKPMQVDGVPSWAGSYSFKRVLFNWVDRIGGVRLYLYPMDEGLFHFKVVVPLSKGWDFVLTPEQVFLLTGIAYTRSAESASDFVFVLNGRRIFIPFELVGRFVRSMQAVMAMHSKRVIHFSQAMHEAALGSETDTEENEKEESPLGKEKRVLH